MLRLTDRLDALERTRGVGAPRPLPVVLRGTATDAELDKLRRDGVEVYRWSDPGLLDCFV